MADPVVSVLIPAHNAAPWIAETLESVLAQTWPALEVIVAEGGSADGTREIVRRYESRRVCVLPDAPGANAAINRNRAARAATGDFLQFLDADDLIGPDKIRLQIARLREHPDGVASAEWARFRNSPGEAEFAPEPVWKDLDGWAWLVAACTGGRPMMQPGLWLIPRHIAARAGSWDEQLTLIDDFEYASRLLLASGGVCFCPGARLYYRSGNPLSLASRRTPEAWRSAWRSLSRGTEALLARGRNGDAERACADLFQQLAFDAYLEDDDVCALAESRARELGGSRVDMDGGLLFRLVRDAAGWKAAKQIKRACYRLGYGRVAKAKQAAFSGWA